jgi:para-nitrobenzyl esterase
MIILATILSFGGFANPASANEHGYGKPDCEHPWGHCGWLNDPIKIEGGYIAGTLIGDPDDPVHIYRGIPYAASPVGDLRWKPPQPVIPWAGIRETTKFGKMAIQTGGPFVSMGLQESEDCLYLNVVTPAKHPHQKLPVMVWFHGGGFDNSTGTDPLFNNYRLPQYGVVTVSVNHRLGALGLLAHPLLSAESPYGVSGNYMFLDMLASLMWVKKNIAAFGGDPYNITIFGESGGGAKVGALAASPMGKKMFHKGICESGSAGTGVALADVEARGAQLFERLDVSTLEDARKLTPKQIIDADLLMRSELKLGGWSVTIDDWFISDSPINIFLAGKQNRIPMILGANLGELGPGIISMPQVIPAYVNMFTGLNKAGVNGYAYIFDQVPINWKEKGGVATHAIELAYVFGDYDNTTPYLWPLIYALETFYGIGPDDMVPILTEVDKRVSENTMAMWAQFARIGNPSIKGLVSWPAWDSFSDKYLYIADPLQIKSGFSEVGQ